jgi:hypothetical protein
VSFLIKKMSKIQIYNTSKKKKKKKEKKRTEKNGGGVASEPSRGGRCHIWEWLEDHPSLLWGGTQATSNGVKGGASTPTPIG